MTQQELQEILENHKKWLNDEKGGVRANLTGADLTDADLTGAYLTGADLTGAYLADANLTGAYLACSSLTDANLTGAYLACSSLTDANLTGANLTGAYLACSSLTDANLARANLTGANLARANLTGAKIFIPMSCPDTGSFIGWKKCENDLIVKLLIPESAKRVSSTGRKCRCDKAKIIDIQKKDGSAAESDIAISTHCKNFVYKIGETVSVDDFNDDIRLECAPGIHFFINRQEAVDY